MAQHDYVIDNQTAPNFRADLNSALAAIVSTNSGASEPSTTYGNMMWYDTTAKILKMRNEADDAWIDLGTLDQVANTFAANVALASQAEAQAGTNNTRPITPLRLREGLNASGSAPIYACRAWVNFNGTNGSYPRQWECVECDNGSKLAITRSTSSHAMPDENYALTFLLDSDFDHGEPIHRCRDPSKCLHAAEFERAFKLPDFYWIKLCVGQFEHRHARGLRRHLPLKGTP
jgi:hypothetical protein